MDYSTKMQTAQFRWFLNIILAGLIFVNAEAGRLLGIHTLPLQFSPVWPATGFSLAALLLFGNKAWPGVFVGNLCYNLVHLLLEGTGFVAPVTVALVISLGSLSQALVGNWVMRHYCSSGYFKTIKDVVVFLLGGGFITCTIAATVGVITFLLYGVLQVDTAAFSWLTFWLGDVMGVYVFTPLLIVWSLKRFPYELEEKISELSCMLLLFVILSMLFYSVPFYPPIYFFIPYVLWVGYRLGFHGVTVALLLISITTIAITTLSEGWFTNRYPTNSLLILVMFLETLILTGLFAGAVNRELRS